MEIKRLDHVTAYIPALDGLRALSISLVFAGHVGLGNFVPGGFGVTTFFFISGFIITNLLISEHNAHGAINLRLFYIRRVLRLYPALLLMLILTTIFILYTGFSFPAKELVAALFYFENYYFALAGADIFHYKILWSLAVEEHFYLLFPFILIVLVKKDEVFLFSIISLIMLALLLRIHIAIKFHADQVAFTRTYILTHCRYDSILYGCLLGIIVNTRYKNTFLGMNTSVRVFGVGIALILFSFLYQDEFFRQTYRYSLQGIGLLLTIPAILFNSRYNFLNKILSLKALVYIGQLSYSIYLFHFLADTICSEYFKGNSASRITIMTLITVILSLFSYHIIEKPFLKLRRRFGSQVTTTL